MARAKSTGATKREIREAIKVVLAASPVLGGEDADLIAAVFAPAIAARRDRWIELLAQSIRESMQRIPEILEARHLSHSEVFASVALRATHAAIRTHDDEKLDALSNVVANAIVNPPYEEGLLEMIVTLIDDWTGWHIRFLRFFRHPARYVDLTNLLEMRHRTIWTALLSAFPKVERMDSRICDWIMHDLRGAGLIRVDAVHAPARALLEQATTELGHECVRLISKPTLHRR